jgi:hypothetical protein
VWDVFRQGTEPGRKRFLRRVRLRNDKIKGGRLRSDRIEESALEDKIEESVLEDKIEEAGVGMTKWERL